MKKQILLNLEDGNFEQGFNQATIKIQGNGDNSIVNSNPIVCQLPQAPELSNYYRNWRENYQELIDYSRGIDREQRTRFSMPEYIAMCNQCNESLDDLYQSFNDWLSSIKQNLESILDINPKDEIHFVIQTQNISCEFTKNILHKLPWHRWDLFREDCFAEAALSFSKSWGASQFCTLAIFKGTETLALSLLWVMNAPVSGRLKQVKILCVLGESSDGIDVERDRQLINKIPGAYPVFLRQPTISKLKSTLREGWDILFFSGHSKTHEDGQTGLLKINSNEWLDIEDIRETIKAAIKLGMKLAIFNSCDGLGLARKLADLDVAQIIIWREPVPDKIAQEFLKSFLQSFTADTEDLSLYCSVREARLKVQKYIEQHEQLPEITWLPVIHQNLAKESITWRKLRTNELIDRENVIINSLILLGKTVEKEWVQGVLEKSLHREERADNSSQDAMRREEMLELGLEEIFDAVEPPSLMQGQIPTPSRKTLHSGTRVVNKFYEFPQQERTMLILGEPGSGKTIALLEIAREYIQDIEQGSKIPVPVYLNLSSWDSKNLLNQQQRARQNTLKKRFLKLFNPTSHNQRIQFFTIWLVEELHRLYKFPKNQCLDWVRQEKLLLLLDGLDEVKERQRNSCISAINQFIEEHPKTEIVVCCRSQDYSTASEKLQLHSVIEIKPFTSEQINRYLDDLGTPLAGVRALLRREQALPKQEQPLRKLAENALMLKIITTAYKNMSEEDLSVINEERQQHLLNTYIRQGFEKDSSLSRKNSNKQSIRWLAWLAARGMKESGSIFLIEDMQPTTLLTETQKNLYNLGFRLIFGLIAGLAASLHFGTQVTDDLPSLISLVIPSVISGLISALSSLVIPGLVSGLLFVLIITILIGKEVPNLISLLSPLLIDGVVFGLFLSLVSQEIEVVDAIKWSWKQAKNYSLYGLIGAIVYIVLRLLLTQRYYVENGYYYILYEILFFPLLAGLIGGLYKEEEKTEDKTILPNQGIWESATNVSIFFAAFLPTGMLLALPYSRGGIHEVISIGLAVGLLAGLAGGRPPVFAGLVLIKHFVLRVILWLTGYIPWNYTRFLDDATKRGFLRQVGGGFIFLHKFLQEHFSQMDS